LPLVRFVDASPVYFDRHTLSLKGRLLSLFTPDGRTRVAVALAEEDEALFAHKRLREALLNRNESGDFVLRLRFDDGEDEMEVQDQLPLAAPYPQPIPTYVTVQEAA
jgi:hypothetical protein